MKYGFRLYMCVESFRGCQQHSCMAALFGSNHYVRHIEVEGVLVNGGGWFVNEKEGEGGGAGGGGGGGERERERERERGRERGRGRERERERGGRGRANV